MISSAEEARLLLKKWISESARVVAFATTKAMPAEFVIRLKGSIARVEESTDTVVFESGDNFILFGLNGVIQYQELVEISGSLPQIFARESQQWTEALSLAYHGGTLLFCTNS